MAEKQEVLKRTYDEQAKKVAETERAYESMVRQYGETSSEAQELETQLHNERAALYARPLIVRFLQTARQPLRPAKQPVGY